MNKKDIIKQIKCQGVPKDTKSVIIIYPVNTDYESRNEIQKICSDYFGVDVISIPDALHYDLITNEVIGIVITVPKDMPPEYEAELKKISKDFFESMSIAVVFIPEGIKYEAVVK